MSRQLPVRQLETAAQDFDLHFVPEIERVTIVDLAGVRHAAPSVPKNHRAQREDGCADPNEHGGTLFREVRRGFHCQTSRQGLGLFRGLAKPVRDSSGERRITLS